MAAAWLRVVYSVFAFPLLLAWVSVTWGSASPTRWTLLNFCAWPLVLFSSVLVHELGHAIVGWLVGLSPRGISIGLGREVARWKFGTQLAVFINALMLATNLLPVTFSAGFGSDGLRLLTIPFLAREQLEEVLNADLLLDAHGAIERHDLVEARRCMTMALAQTPRAVSVRGMCATIEMEAGNYVRAREQLLALRAEEPKDLRVRLVIDNNLAWLDFLALDLEHLDEADKLSEEVVKKFGSAAFALGTRGAVLSWMGKTEEACRFLERAHTTNTGKWARAINACCLTLAYAQGGDFARAQTWLAQAQQEDPACTLLPRARASLQGVSLAIR